MSRSGARTHRLSTARPAGLSAGTLGVVMAWIGGLAIARLTGATPVVILLAASLVWFTAALFAGYLALRNVVVGQLSMPPLSTATEAFPIGLELHSSAPVWVELRADAEVISSGWSGDGEFAGTAVIAGRGRVDDIEVRVRSAGVTGMVWWLPSGPRSGSRSRRRSSPPAGQRTRDAWPRSMRAASSPVDRGRSPARSTASGRGGRATATSRCTGRRRCDRGSWWCTTVATTPSGGSRCGHSVPPPTRTPRPAGHAGRSSRGCAQERRSSRVVDDSEPVAIPDPGSGRALDGVGRPRRRCAVEARPPSLPGGTRDQRPVGGTLVGGGCHVGLARDAQRSARVRAADHSGDQPGDDRRRSRLGAVAGVGRARATVRAPDRGARGAAGVPARGRRRRDHCRACSRCCADRCHRCW